jgi:hypothetical protein
MSSRRTDRVQRKIRIPSSSKKKSNKEKVAMVGEMPCCINDCDGYADKHMGGRSLSQENGIETWGEGSFTVRKNRVRVCKNCYKVWKKDNKEDKNTQY